MGTALLAIQDFSLHMPHGGSSRTVVSNMDLRIEAGKITCLVGESGCGKSLTALAIPGLLPGGFTATGKILFDGKNLLEQPEHVLRRIRGKEISLVFQEPMTALNPVLPIGEQVAEALRLHLRMGRREARENVLELFRRVGIPEPENRYTAYPHQFSGGMRQRVMIAMALSCRPRLILADEPTTALDVTIQNQILRLLRDQTQQHGMGLLLITHDLGVVARMAHHVGIMYAGRLVESAPAGILFAAPRHPYTCGLMACAPTMASGSLRRLPTIEGVVPPPGTIRQGCAFRDRCPRAEARCRTETPRLSSSPHRVACWNPLS